MSVSYAVLCASWQLLSRVHLVAETLGGDDGDLITYSLVGLEVERELGVVSFDNDLGGLLDCLLFVVSMTVQ